MSKEEKQRAAGGLDYQSLRWKDMIGKELKIRVVRDLDDRHDEWIRFTIVGEDGDGNLYELHNASYKP